MLNRPPIALILLTVLCATDAFLFNTGEVSPNDPYVFIGDALNLTCEVTDEAQYPGNVSHLLSFVTKVDGVDTTFSDEYITLVDSRSIRLEYPVTSKEDLGGYTCMLNTTSGKAVTVASQDVIVEHRPETVTEYAVEVYDWSRMTISWGLEQDYVKPDNVVSYLRWRILNGLNNCTHSAETSCTWDVDDGRDSLKVTDRYYVYITVETRLPRGEITDSTTSAFVVNPLYKVRPAPVKNLTVTNKNSTCVTFDWQVSEKSAEYGVMCTVDVAPKQMNISTTNTNLVVCDLKPAMDYIFSVSCIPYMYGDEYGVLSESRSIGARTDEAAPVGSVVMAPGNFRFHECLDTTLCNVTLYWQGVPEGERNGEITLYEIKTPSKTFQVAGTLHHFTIEVEKNSATRIEIKAGTREGLSSVSTTSTLPAFATRLRPPDNLVVEREGSAMYASWQHPDETIRGYTLYYCTGSRSALICNDEIQWIHLLPNETSHRLTFQDGNPDNKLIGISSETRLANQTVTSGILWSPCYYIRNMKPLGVENFMFPEEQPSRGLRATWDKPMCSGATPYVTGYVITYCRGDSNVCTGRSYNESLENTVDSYLIKDLEVGANYRVTVRALSRSGEGPISAPITAVVKENGLSRADIVGISIGGVFVLILVLAVVIFCARRIWRSYKKEIPIELPGQFPQGDTAPELPSKHPPLRSVDGNGNEVKKAKSTPDEISDDAEAEISDGLDKTMSTHNTNVSESTGDHISSGSTGSANSTNILLTESRGKVVGKSLHITIPRIGSSDTGMTNPGYVSNTDTGDSHSTADSYSKMTTGFTTSPIGSPVSQLSDSSQTPLIREDTPSPTEKKLTHPDYISKPLPIAADTKASKGNPRPVQNGDYVTYCE